jgi:hypothetical protein
MSYNAIIKKYLRALQEQYKNAASSGQYTAELSYRVPLDTMEKSLAKEFNPNEHIDVILEPTTQGRVGRPDWRIHNQDTMGIYGYIEGKGLSNESFDTAPYAAQIKKYLTLGHKLVITDGIDFVFCMDRDREPIVISIISKDKMSAKDWSAQLVDPRFEIYMREFFRNPSPQQVNEAKLIELVAVRTRMLADEILEFANIPIEEAMNEDESNMIRLLEGMRELVYNHNDSNLRTNEVFADFTAQVIMFCLLYAHRVLCSSDDSPAEKEKKINAYIREDLSEGEALTPFRNLMLYLRDNADRSIFINQRIDECIKFLSFVKMTDQQLMNPDYHQLFELFLSKYDAKSRFDFGAYYTPKILADFVVKLTNYIVSVNFSGKSIYDDGNTIVDPCCGTGSFIEELMRQDSGDGSYNLCGIEILPAPYMLANYRMAVLEKQNGKRRNNVNIILANTLNNSVFNGEANEDSIEGKELIQANKISSRPLKLIIGNPPCSDTLRQNISEDFSIINDLMADFRPPLELRRGRQNIQKQINNPFMQFLRWSCKKLLDSHNHSVLALIVPLSFLEAESYKYARKYLCEHFSDVWAIAVDADARTGARSDSLFHTLQGRAVLILTRYYGQETPITKFHYHDFSHSLRLDKERLLSADIGSIVSNFNEYPLDQDMISFSPTKPFDTEMYIKFWPVSGENGQNAIFLNHCSGIKLAPTAIFTHVKAPMLKRRSREIAANGAAGVREWFAKQDRPPKDEKITAFQNALNQSGDRAAMDRTITDNIHPYSFRPFLTSNVLLWEDVLKRYSKIGGGGTRVRPEIIRAYKDEDTIGFAMAHAPKDLNPTLSQFVSFCWYYPDNDMCTRGNSHIYMNQYPNKQKSAMVSNITPDVLRTVSGMLEKSKEDAAKDIVFYVYAVLCSQVYLDEFEGALFTVNQSDKRARVPIVDDKEIFNNIVQLGKEIAELEKVDYSPENVLKFDYESLISKLPKDFRLKISPHPFDENTEQLLLSDGTTMIALPCPLSLQRLNISGYDVIKGVWLKFNSYDFTHCTFTQDDMRRLLDFLNTIAEHEKLVKNLDDILLPVLHGKVRLFEKEPQW